MSTLTCVRMCCEWLLRRLLTLREQLKPCRSIGCGRRRRNWSECNWPNVAWIRPLQPWPKLVTVELSGHVHTDWSFTPQWELSSFQSHYIAITASRRLAFPSPFRFPHHNLVTEVAAGLITYLVCSRTLPLTCQSAARFSTTVSHSLKISKIPTQNYHYRGTDKTDEILQPTIQYQIICRSA